MATEIRPELSEKNPYWIGKHRYYELKHFCLQYPIWKKAYNALLGLSSRPNDLDIFVKSGQVRSDPTARCAESRVSFAKRMELVEQAAIGTDGDLYIDLSCDYGGFCKGHGSDGQHTTYGAMMYGSNGPGWEPYIIVTNAGARISGTGADLVVSGGITMSEEPSYGSDLRIKNSIDYDLASYEAFFLALKPSTFKYNKGTSGRKHFGFIAQDVEQAMLDTGLTSDQLAALVKDPVKEILSDGITDYRYSIRYGELIALNTHMIQKLYQMVEELLQQKEG